MFMRHTRRRLPALALAAITVLGTAACGGDDGGGTSGGDFSVEHALADLPSSTLDDGYLLTVGDLDAATELAGAERPSPDADRDEIVDWLLPITGVEHDGDQRADVTILLPQAANPAAAARTAEFRDEVGWSIADVGWYAEVGTPPARFTVLHGDIDPAAIDDALGERDGDVWSIGGDDFEIDVASASAARPLGEALRLAEDDGAIAVAKSTPPIEDWLEGGDRLDADEDLVAVAEALDAHDVYAAMLLDGDSLDFGPAARVTEKGLEAIEAKLLDRFDTFGAGLTLVDGEPVGVLVYHHSTSAQAEDNAARLEELFTDGDSVISAQPLNARFDLIDVSVDGQIVTATVGFTDRSLPGNLWTAIQAREIFATHG